MNIKFGPAIVAEEAAMSKSHVIAVAPLAAATILSLIYLYLHGALGINAVPVSGILSDPLVAASERMRMVWGAAAFGLSTAFVANIFVAGMILRNAINSTNRTAARLILVATIASLGAAVYAAFTIDAGGNFANEIIAAISHNAGVDMSSLIRQANCVAAATVAVMLSSACCLSLPLESQDISELSRRINAWFISLASGAVLLAFTVVEVWALYRWGTSYIVAGEAKSASVSTGAAFAASIIFSVLLAGIYLPVAALHARWLSSAIDQAAAKQDSLDVEKWLVRCGIRSSPATVGATILLPALAFVLTTLFKQVVGD